MNTSVEVKGLDEIINKLNSYQNTLPNKVKKFLSKLADIGIDTANIHFSNAQYDGKNDVTVNAPKWISDNTIVVSAQGESVTFIEFGTGIVYTEENPFAENLGMSRGGYGQGKGSQRTWGYYGEQGTNGTYLKSTDKGDLFLTHGNPPARAMYNADKEMRTKILDIAREVFRFD